MVADLRAGFLPQRKQYIAISCPADHVFFGGAVGGGKSAWLLNHTGIQAIQYPGSKHLILRRKTKELRSLIREFRRWFPREVCTLNQNEKQFTFTTSEHPVHGPSLVTFGHMYRDETVADYYSEEYDSISWDEATHFTRFMRTEMEIRLRAPNTRPYRLQMRYGSNPGNVGHYDFKREFVRPPDRDVELLYFWDVTGTSTLLDGTTIEGAWQPFPPGMRGRPLPYIVWRPEKTAEYEQVNEQRVLLGLEPLEGVPSRCYIPSVIQDNQFLFNDAAYLGRLMKLPRKRLRAMVGGDWDAIEGQYFESFDPTVHVIAGGYDPAPNATCWRSLDWGQQAPLACYWHTYDEDWGMVVTYRELYQAGLSDREACRLIQEYTPASERIFGTYADPSMWIGFRHEETQSHAEAYEEFGVPLLKANNSRRHVQNKMRGMLDMNRATGKPYWAITADCLDAIRTLPTLISSERDPEIINDEGEDHAQAAIAYGLAAEPSFIYRRSSRGIVVEAVEDRDAYGLPRAYDSAEVLSIPGAYR